MVYKAVWGPKWWWVLHHSAYSLGSKPDEKKRRQYVSWLDTYADFLPCSTCGTHMKQYLEINPPWEHTESGEKMFEYLYEFHNTTKSEFGGERPTLEEVKAMYGHDGHKRQLQGYEKTLGEMKRMTDNQHKTIKILAIVAIVLSLFASGGIFFSLCNKSNKNKK